MWTMVVIAMQPVLGHQAHFLQRFKDIAVEQLHSVSSVETFDIRVLRRLARLNVVQLYLFTLCPLFQGLGDELRPVVHESGLRHPEDLGKLFQCPHHSFRAWCASAKSAYMRLSLAFSSYNGRIWVRWDTDTPEYCLFHL